MFRWVLLFVLCLAAAAPQLADEVVAVVDQRTITLSDVDLETRVQLILGGGLDAAHSALGKAALAAGLRQVIDEEVLAADADRLHIPPVDGKDVEEAMALLIGRFPTRAAYAAFLSAQDVTEQDLATLFVRDLRAQRYLEGRFRLASRVHDPDIDAYLHAHPDLLRGTSAAAAREVARALLTREHFKKLAEELTEALRHKADVRIIDDLGGS